VFFSDTKGYDDKLAQVFPSYEILEVTSSLEDYSAGEIVYPDDEEVIYVGYPLLVGAIVSGDAYMYSYNLDLVMEKLSRLTGVYYDKSKFIAAQLPDCDYAAMKTALNNYKSVTGAEELRSYSAFLAKLELVEDANKALGGECPEIY